MNGWVRRQATFYVRSVSVDDATGAESESWLPLVEVGNTSPPTGAKFWVTTRDPMPGRSESVSSGLQVARNQTALRMRWRSDITSAMKVVLHGDADVEYQIVGGPAEVIGRKREIEVSLEKYSS